uniref:Secretion regulating guanine nucleotide exchange factor n=1 Tax=Cyprinus carpio carpio TaxID=630221 RepID=A0A8C1DGR8_CYPCA
MSLSSESGELLMCGQNHKGQSQEVITFQPCPLPGCSRVQQVSCGWDFSVINSDCDGQVLVCSSNAFGQLGFSPGITHSAEPFHPVTSVAAGLRHALASTASGCVYQWGTGLSSHAKRMLSPHPVPAHLSSKEPCLVPVAGSTHCVCLTVKGDVFLWGSNKHDQRVTDVHSGWTHLVVKTESGRVFTWGRANYGQLGQINQSTEKEYDISTSSGQSISRPVEVKALFGATQIACGSEHNLAVVGGRIVSWGWNEHKMCGDGSLCDIPQPQPIPCFRDITSNEDSTS